MTKLVMLEPISSHEPWSLTRKKNCERSTCVSPGHGIVCGRACSREVEAVKEREVE